MKRFGPRAVLAACIPFLASFNPISAETGVDRSTPPARIDTAALGKPAFVDEFRALDAGVDPDGASVHHRWRTVFGYGNAMAPEYRTSSEGSLFVDPAFTGVEHGKLGAAPLGLNPFSIQPDGLIITARRTPAVLRPVMFGREWHSGLLTTYRSYAQPWGYWEITADLPACVHGAWSGFWLLATDNKWPDHGEVDFPETIGDGTLYLSVHSKGNAAGGLSGGRTDAFTPPTPCERGPHRYGVRLSRATIAFYFDDRLVGTQPTPPGFGTPMYLLMDLAMRGPWADSKGLPDPAMDSVRMGIRSVRIWRMDGN